MHGDVGEGGGLGNVIPEFRTVDEQRAVFVSRSGGEGKALYGEGADFQAPGLDVHPVSSWLAQVAYCLYRSRRRVSSWAAIMAKRLGPNKPKGRVRSGRSHRFGHVDNFAGVMQATRR